MPDVAVPYHGRVKRAAIVITLFLSLASLRAQAPPPFQVEEVTIAQIHDALKAGRVTCRGLVERYIRRIEAYDKNGPAINAIVVINPEALKQADDLDRRASQAGFAGPLHCVPTIVKDNFETIGLQSANGSLALAGFVSNKDAFLVKRMKEAGAIVLAKSNMAEWAFTPYETLSSILPGYTRNPYALDRVTAGSSGGTAAAVAASFGAVGLGSDTGNSIRGPSSHQALVGIRSTMGLTSRAGVMPLNLLADIAGPMARSVSDAVAVFQVIVGDDPDDPATSASRGRARGKLLDIADPRRPARRADRRASSGYERDTTDAEIVDVFMNAVEDLRRAGATIVDPARVEGLEQIRRAQASGRAWDSGTTSIAISPSHGDRIPVHNLSDIVKSGRFHPTVQRRLEQAEQGAENGPDRLPAKRRRSIASRFARAVTKTMDAHKLDAFVYPTWSNPPRLIGDLNTPHGDNSQFFSPTTGFPSIQVPMGYTRGGLLPAGITFFGRAWAEPTLIKLAYSYEQATHHRRPPPPTPPIR